MGRRGSLNKVQPKDHDRRPIRWRRYPHLFLIVCEDQKTEPFYFEGFKELFPEETVFIKAVGTGRSSIGVVEQAKKEKRRLYSESRKEVDEVWVVFDKDDAEKSLGNTLRFNEAFRISAENKFRIAYSNEVFELWLLIHFVDISADLPIPRQNIYDALEKAIKSQKGFHNFEYKHGDLNVLEPLKRLGNERDAIERAEKLLSKFKEIQPIDANPSTTVHILIKRLRELESWYLNVP